MSIEHPTTSAALDSLRTALTQLRALAALPSADPRYIRAAEQVAAIIADLECGPEASFGTSLPPSPG